MLLHILLLTTLVSGNDYDYGTRSSHYTAPATQAMILSGDACLPVTVVTQMAEWLDRVQIMEQQRMLHAIGLQRLIREMEAGQSLCAALPLALDRMYGKHELSLKQRRVMGVPIEWGDGWQETSERMTKAMETVESECRASEARDSAYDGVKWPHKREILMCLKRGEKESKKATVVYHMP
jgi:hypothetical protein